MTRLPREGAQLSIAPVNGTAHPDRLD
jgi:hypothetical protein